MTEPELKPPLYRKKPVVVAARQWARGSSAADLAKWCGGDVLVDMAGALISVPTLEGRLTARETDWIIRGVRGEFYPCKPDIFEATYEPANSTSRAPWKPEEIEALKWAAALARNYSPEVGSLFEKHAATLERMIEERS